MEADVRALFEQPTLAGYAAITERMEIVLSASINCWRR